MKKWSSSTTVYNGGWGVVKVLWIVRWRSRHGRTGLTMLLRGGIIDRLNTPEALRALLMMDSLTDDKTKRRLEPSLACVKLVKLSALEFTMKQRRA